MVYEMVKGVPQAKNKNVLLNATFGSGSQLTARWLSITPLTHGIIVHVIEVRFCHLDDGSKVTLVLRLHIGDSKASCCLHANHGTKASLALDNWPEGMQRLKMVLKLKTIEPA